MNLYLTQTLHRAVRQQPQSLATVFGARRQTQQAFIDRIARLAAVLHSLGVRADDRVAIVSLNSDRMIECLFACFWAGAVASPLNTRWTAAETRHALSDSAASLLVVDDSFVPLAQTLIAAGDVRDVLYIGEGATPVGMVGSETLLAQTPACKDATRNGDDLALLLYTGGTTGSPKGVMLSHGNMASAALGMSAMGLGSTGTLLLAVPLFHMAGIQLLFNHCLSGGAIVVLPAFQPATALATLASESITTLMLVPTMLQMLVEHPEATQHDLSKLRRVFYGASPISESLLQKAMQMLPQAEFAQGYGMTETGITLMLPHQYHTPQGQALGKLTSAGMAVPSAEVRIVDANDIEVPRGVAGEIVSRGPMVMRGYWNQPQLTAEALRGDWMHTGDIGRMDEDGFVFIVDRLKDMIVSGGENVYSVEVENALAQHRDVAQCAVIGVPDANWGERVHAVIVLRPGATADEQALITHCRPLIAGYKCPRSIEFRQSMPLSAAGKLLKTELRAPYWQGQQRAVA